MAYSVTAMRDIRMSIDEYLALTPEEKCKFTEVIFDFLYDERQLDREVAKDREEDSRDEFR